MGRQRASDSFYDSLEPKRRSHHYAAPLYDDAACTGLVALADYIGGRRGAEGVYATVYEGGAKPDLLRTGPRQRQVAYRAASERATVRFSPGLRRHTPRSSCLRIPQLMHVMDSVSVNTRKPHAALPDTPHSAHCPCRALSRLTIVRVSSRSGLRRVFAPVYARCGCA